MFLRVAEDIEALAKEKECDILYYLISLQRTLINWVFQLSTSYHLTSERIRSTTSTSNDEKCHHAPPPSMEYCFQMRVIMTLSDRHLFVASLKSQTSASQ